jgi:hypothetical protein
MRSIGKYAINPSRAYLMRAMFVAGLSGNAADAERLQGEAIKILEWGARKWANVPTSERGAVFTSTFIRGCKSMQLENYMHVRTYCLHTCGLEPLTNVPCSGFLQRSGPRGTPVFSRRSS